MYHIEMQKMYICKNKLMSKQKVIIVSAPSGAGKTTIVQQLLARPEFRLEFSVSACSRAKREHEIHGQHYYFISADEFRQKIDNNEFLEWEEVYTDSFYGTLKSEIDRVFGNNNNLIFDVDVLGGMNLKKYFGQQALSIFIMPPSIEELECRLRKRSTDSNEAILRRIAKAEYEMQFATQFDIKIINDILDQAISETISLVDNFLNQN